jgi:hypothetical protein
MRQKRAHNASQTLEGGVSPMIMDRVPSCTEAFNTFWRRAKEVYDACPPGSDGTYTHCTRTQMQSYLNCAEKEISCTAGALGCS